MKNPLNRFRNWYAGRSGGKNNNGLGTFLKSRSRWFWNTRQLGTYDVGRNKMKAERLFNKKFAKFQRRAEKQEARRAAREMLQWSP